MAKDRARADPRPRGRAEAARAERASLHAPASEAAARTAPENLRAVGPGAVAPAAPANLHAAEPGAVDRPKERPRRAEAVLPRAERTESKALAHRG